MDTHGSHAIATDDEVTAAYAEAVASAKDELAEANKEYLELCEALDKIRRDSRGKTVHSARTIVNSSARLATDASARRKLEHDAVNAKIRRDSAREMVNNLRTGGIAAIVTFERTARIRQLRAEHKIRFDDVRTGSCTNPDCGWTHVRDPRTDIFQEFLEHITAIELIEHRATLTARYASG